MKKLLFLLFLFSLLKGISQLDSIGHLEYSSNLNDVWGYEDELGNQYALVGLVDGLSIVDISDPENPNEVFRALGPETPWRDIKTFGDYVYVTNEADSGLRIYDLSGLPSSFSIPYKNFSNPSGGDFTKAHNLYIDENGFAYIAGTDREEETIILDLNPDPWNPIEVGVIDLNYLHDVYVSNDTLLGSAINEGEFQMFDVSDKSNPILISSIQTGSRFTHNVWPSFNGPYVYTTDEIDGGAIEVYDISDPTDIEFVESFKSKTLGDEMPHNVHVEDSIVVISYYKEGVVVLDGSRPQNLVELSRFDTDKKLAGPLSGGCWGVYPHFGDGRIIATDITKGLFVLDYSPLHAGYLEGVVLDADTDFPLSGVEVKVLEGNKQSNTSFDGEFKEGSVDGKELKVRFFLNGYSPDTLNAIIEENKVLFDTVRLKKIPTESIVVSVDLDGVRAGAGIFVALESDYFSFEGETDASGEVIIANCPIGFYQFHAGEWGYINACFSDSVNSSKNNFTFNLTPGYFDDFSADQGWEASAVREDVLWERGVPEPSINPDNGEMYDPDTDDPVGACDGYAYVTGINSNLVALSTTVNFTNFLVSPEVSFPVGNDNVEVSFSYYLGLSDKASDSLHVGLVNGTDTLYYLALNNEFTTFAWDRISFNSSDLGWGNKPFKIIFKITDDLSPWDIVDGSIDNVSLNFGSVNVEEVEACLSFSDHLIKFKCGPVEYNIFNIEGRLIRCGVSDQIEMSGLKHGLYFIKTSTNQEIKFLKVEK